VPCSIYMANLNYMYLIVDLPSGEVTSNYLGLGLGLGLGLELSDGMMMGLHPTMSLSLTSIHRWQG